jgi:tetratricopeptide (TPR) repeat protein
MKKGPSDIIQMHYALANLYSYPGEMDKAVAQWELAYQVASSKLPDAMPELEEVLGIAYLHKSEMENDVYRHPADRCIWPPKTASAFANTTDSEKALAYLQKYLARHPEALDARWLLNITYATLGKYPDGVPQQFVIPPSVFGLSSDPNIPHFHDVAPQAGLNLYETAGGLIVDDFDNDGLLDIVVSDWSQCGHMHFFHNNGDGTFTDRTAQAGLADQLSGLNLIQADYDNDGCLDIFVLRGAWEFSERPSLLHNNCNGTFTDVTKQAGLDVANQSQAATWADIDNDGYLDLFIGNEGHPSHLYRNNGNGTFEDISHKAGVDRTAYTKGVVAADYDNDGFIDFYVSNLDGNNYLYHNNHNGTFTDVAEKAGVQKPLQSFPAWFFDYDNDGWPDIFVASYYVSVDEVMRSYLGTPHNSETLKLYHNNHDGTFKDVTTEVGLDRVFMPMGANFGDIDNDGYLDIYLGTGNPVYASLLPNVLFHNEQGKRFVDVTAATGTGDLHKGHGVAFADIDRDGDEDLLEEIGGAVPGDAHAFRLFENPGNTNKWINLKLIGTKSNRSAMGAKIKVTIDEGGQARSIYRTVGSGGSFGASPLEQHIGLGKADRITEINITWPATNKHQTFTNVAPNQFLEIKEGQPSFRRLDYHSVKLGGAK